MNKKLIIIVVFIVVIAIVSFNLLKGKKEGLQETEVLEKIDSYNYVLYETATTFYKDTFKELKNILSKEVVNEEDYVSTISKLFIIDFYTLDNKVTNQDIGGIQYVHPDYSLNLQEKAKNTIYKYVMSNVYGDRNQELPIINKVDIINISRTTYDYKTVKDTNAYSVELSFDYNKDLGYSKTATLTVIHKENKLYIIEVK